MAEYTCEHCHGIITQNRLELAIIKGKLVYFHPQRCPVFTSGTDCLLNYHAKHGAPRDVLATDREDLEATSEQEFIELLQERALQE